MTDAIYTGPTTKSAAFTSKDSHPLLLDLILLQDFGREYIEWEADTVWREIQLTHGVAVSDISKNKIQAARTCHTTDNPYRYWEIFEKVAVSFDGATPLFDIIQKPSAHVCAAALTTMAFLRDVAVADEVYKFIGAVLLDEGILYGPGVLEPVNKYVAQGNEAAQKRIEALVKSGKTPRFDGSNDDDVQWYKSLSVEDFVTYNSKLLISQIDAVFKRGK